MSILKANRIENLTTTDGGININNSGQVAIGVASASKPLHIYQTADAGIRIQNSTTGTGTTDGILLEATGSDGLFWNYESGNLRFATGNSERLRIDSIGRVGIGTSSPAFGVGSGLEIERAGSATLRIEDSASSSGFEIQNASGSIDFNGYNSQPFTFKHNTTERLRINSSGVTVSSGNLSMHSGGRIFVGNGGNAVNPMFANVSDTNTGIAFPSADTMLLSTGGSERLRIDSSGNVGIGTSSPVSIFDVTVGASGQRRFVANYDDSIITIKGSNAASNPETFRVIGDNIRFNTGTSGSGTERMRLTNNGLTFNGDTAQANALSDYEEGTFTPTVQGSTTVGTATYTVQRGKYTKIGDRVFFEIYVHWDSGTGSGSALYINGLPFTADNSIQTYPGTTIGYFHNLSFASNSSPGALIASGHTYVYFYSIPNGGGSNSAIGYDSSGSIIMTGHYKVN